MEGSNRWIPCTDPSEAWREGWNRLLRLRVIVGVSAIDAIVFTGSLCSQLDWKLSIIITLPGLVVVGVLWTLRTIVVHTTDAGIALHRLTHFLRSDVAKIWESANSPEPERQLLYRERYNQFHDKAANHVAEIFRKLTSDQTINCAIRLATRTNGESEYVTVGRSQNMHPSRVEMSQPIPNDKGIARYLRDRQRRGVKIVDNIGKAIREEEWQPNPTDKLPDVKALLIAAVNGYDFISHGSVEKSMLGILYVTSSERKFGQRHADLIMSFADLLGLVYPVITGALG